MPRKWELRGLDAISYKYRINVPPAHRLAYVDWWFKRWHACRDAAIDRYIAKHVVWC